MLRIALGLDMKKHLCTLEYLTIRHSLMVSLSRMFQFSDRLRLRLRFSLRHT